MNTNAALNAILAAASANLNCRSPVASDTRESLAMNAIKFLAIAASDGTVDVSACLAGAEVCICRIRETLPVETVESILADAEES